VTGALLEIDFWNVGQGDCTVIKLPDGNLIIIDVGPRGCPLIEWLREGVRRNVHIEAVVLTHNDADHTGSLPVLIQEFRSRIGGVWMLLDRPKKDDQFQKVFRAAYQGESEGYYKISRLEDGHVLWKHELSESCLRVIHPSMSQNVLATDPNDSSGMIVLDVEGRNLVTWPGDLQLTTTAEVLRGWSPETLMGPHHGGPSDYPTKAIRKKLTGEKRFNRMQEMRDAASGLRPLRNFISVGTQNSYHHPRPGYLRLLAGQGTQVICSQLTVCCDRQQVKSGKPVFEGAGALGLRTAKSGVSCRGAMRLYLKDGKIHPDEFTSKHRERVEQLYRPQCLRVPKHGA
jgi:beta-lactamase superfamily II metal-dependent hydrolase